jgi:predicted nucleic acid-binding protein
MKCSIGPPKGLEDERGPRRPSLRWCGRFGPIVLVVDSSVLVVALVDSTEVGERARSRLCGEALAAPELVDLEFASVMRRLVGIGSITPRRAALAIGDLIDLPLDRARHQRLLPRILQLRENVTAYDAAYVALAEALKCSLVTADQRLARAPGVQCEVDVFA